MSLVHDCQRRSVTSRRRQKRPRWIGLSRPAARQRGPESGIPPHGQSPATRTTHLLPPVHKNLGKRSGIQTGAANERPVNIGLGHQRCNVLRPYTATVLDTYRGRDGLTPYL